MIERFPLGATARFFNDIIAAGVGVAAQEPTIAIRRQSDGKWFQLSDASWQTTVVEHLMAPTDVTNLPGRYHFDFDQALDTMVASTMYVVTLKNLGSYARLEYRDVGFGPMAAVENMTLCSVQGSIVSVQGDPIVNVPIRATLVPVFLGGLGRAVENGRIAVAYTDYAGNFDLPLVRGGIFRLEIGTVGYDRKVTIPDLASVLFTDL